MLEFRVTRGTLPSRAPASLIVASIACVLGCAKPLVSTARLVDSLALAGWTPRELRAGDNGARQAALDSITRGARLAIVIHERTYEGDPLPKYLVADGGRVRLLLDTRQDRWSERQSRGLWETPIDSVTLGYTTELPERGPQYAALPPEAARVSLRPLFLLAWGRGRVIDAF